MSLTSYFPRAIMPLLAASAAATFVMHFVRGYVCPAEDSEDRRRGVRESVLCFLAAVLACFIWHVVGPFSDHWHYLIGGIGGGTTSAAGGEGGLSLHDLVGRAVPVDTSIPTW